MERLQRTATAASVSTDFSQPGQVFCGVIVFLTLVCFALFFDRGKKGLLNMVSVPYKPVIHAFFEEISTFGFVSLLAFLAVKEWNGVSIVQMIGNNVGDGQYG